MTSQRYNALKAMKRCVKCGKNKADEGYTTCLVCRMDMRGRKENRSCEAKYRHSQWLKRRRDIQYAFGVCIVCGKRDAEDGSSSCGRCNAKARIRAQENRFKKGIIPRPVMLDGKHCAMCGSENILSGSRLCLKHYTAAKSAMLNARSQRKTINYFELRIKNNI